MIFFSFFFQKMLNLKNHWHIKKNLSSNFIFMEYNVQPYGFAIFDKKIHNNTDFIEYLGANPHFL